MLPKAQRAQVVALPLSDAEHIKLQTRARRAGMDRPRPGKRPWPWDAQAAAAMERHGPPLLRVLARDCQAKPQARGDEANPDLAPETRGTALVAPAAPAALTREPRPRPRPEDDWELPIDRASIWRKLLPRPQRPE